MQNLVSISPTLYAQLFCTKVLQKAFLYYTFQVCTFWAQGYWQKNARQVLVKLAPGVKYITFNESICAKKKFKPKM